MAKTYIPQAGDVVWLEFDPQAGHEQKGKRPALVLSPAGYNAKTGLMVCCPITNQVKGYPFEVLIEANADVSGAVLSDQVKALDWRARNAKFKGTITVDQMREVRGKIKALLGIQ